MVQKNSLCVGVLAFQGAFRAHLHSLEALNVKTIEVRKNEDLNFCQGLIIPGGESTVISHLIEKAGMRTPLINFSNDYPLFGTCAGLILMAKSILNDSMKGLQILDISVERNAYGRQVDSFISSFHGELEDIDNKITGFFIRAPQIAEILNSSIQVLAKHQNRPVLIQQGYHLGATFHPELTNDLSIHKYFLKLINSCVNTRNCHL